MFILEEGIHFTGNARRCSKCKFIPTYNFTVTYTYTTFGAKGLISLLINFCGFSKVFSTALRSANCLFICYKKHFLSISNDHDLKLV